jgi:hypothetical protein
VGGRAAAAWKLPWRPVWTTIEMNWRRRLQAAAVCSHMPWPGSNSDSIIVERKRAMLRMILIIYIQISSFATFAVTNCICCCKQFIYVISWKLSVVGTTFWAARRQCEGVPRSLPSPSRALPHSAPQPTTISSQIS